MVFYQSDNLGTPKPAGLRNLEVEHAESMGILRTYYVKDLHSEVEHPVLPLLRKPAEHHCAE